MKAKAVLLFLLVFYIGAAPSFAQTILGRAASDFYTAFALMAIDNKRFTEFEDLKPYISPDAFLMMEENLTYRVGFIGFAVNQLGVISGNTGSRGFMNTLNALTGFIMFIEERDELQEWSVREISNRYETYLASSWHNVNMPLFIAILDAYCAYMRGELWRY